MIHIEPFEGRRLLSASLSGGVLHVNGSNSADAIACSLDSNNPATLRVVINGHVSTFLAADVTEIVVKAGQGNDRINLDGLHIKSNIGAGGGHDLIVGTAVSDVIDCGPGNDTVQAGNGDDSIVGDAGNDSISGGNGNDDVFGGDGANTILGGNGSDSLSGGSGSDNIHGGAGNDQLVGGGGDDILNGDAGNDTLFGEDGNDLIATGDGNDSADGGAGNDMIWGGAGDDYLSGSDGNDQVMGEAGNDSIGGGNGTDLIYGGPGADEFGALGTQSERKDYNAAEGDHIQTLSDGAYGGSTTTSINHLTLGVAGSGSIAGYQGGLMIIEGGLIDQIIIRPKS